MVMKFFSSTSVVKRCDRKQFHPFLILLNLTIIIISAVSVFSQPITSVSSQPIPSVSSQPIPSVSSQHFRKISYPPFPTISYSDHCASIVPKASPTTRMLNHRLFLGPETSHFTGSTKIFGSQFPFEKTTLSFNITPFLYETNTSGVYMVEGHLVFRSYVVTNSISREPKYGILDSLNFQLRGFWSVSSGKLCMVGSASWHSRNGKPLDLQAVFKLNYVKNMTISTSLVSGVLENLVSPDDPNYFEPVSILAFTQATQYNYTLVSEGSFKDFSGDGIDIPSNSVLSLEPGEICSMFSRGIVTYKLKYPSKCNSSQNCTPFGGGIGYLPPFLSLYSIQCSGNENMLRYVVGFQNGSRLGYHQSFDPKKALVGEGKWDRKKNQLSIVACQILNQTGGPGNAQVGDCTTRLSLWYPAVWSIRKRVSVEGHIWTNKTAGETGCFERIKFESSDDSVVDAPGWRYEYTEIDRVRRSCLAKKTVKEKVEKYRDRNSSYMQFKMTMQYATELCSWGDAFPISIGNRFYKRRSESQLGNHTVDSRAMHISYKLSFPQPYGLTPGGGPFPWKFPLSPDGGLEIYAEGVYDEETGQLCMVGCRNLAVHNLTSVSMDCEILVNFQFPLRNTKRVYTKGIIESTREKNDPLYFKQFSVSSRAICKFEAKRSISRMDLEIIMVILSNTLGCFFVATQLFYVLNHPDMLPFISIFMLLILTLGQVIPLGPSFVRMFSKYSNTQILWIGRHKWLEGKEVIVRAVNLAAALLQCHLLLLTWMARSGDRSKNKLWLSERKAMFASLLFYTLGGTIALVVSWKKNRYSSGIFSTLAAAYRKGSVMRDLRYCGGWVLDGFLVPQILLNIFQISGGNVLSLWFYVGTTLVRVLPHAYDIYRAHNYQHMDGSYIYADPSAEFYSYAGNVILPCFGIMFASIIYLQQRFGGHYIFPRRLRD